MFRVLHVSDLHFNSEFPNVVPNWDAVVAYVAGTKPDLVLVTGDIVEAPDSDPSYELAVEHLARLEADWVAIPGDHDVGSPPPVPAAYRTEPVTTARVERFRKWIGPDRWVHRCGEWTIIGVNSNLFGTGLEMEQEQWTWLDEQLAQAEPQPIALAWHRPPAERALPSPYLNPRTVHPTAQQWLQTARRSHDIRLVVCGHLHQYMTYLIDGLPVVVAPSLVMHDHFLPGPDFPSGQRISGAVEYQFDGPRVAFNLCIPPGVGQVQAPPDSETARSRPPIG